MAGWNYRVVKHTGHSYYEIHEVYYDDNDKPDGLTIEAVGPGGATREEFLASKALYDQAYQKPVLLFDGGKFIGEEPALRGG